MVSGMMTSLLLVGDGDIVRHVGRGCNRVVDIGCVPDFVGDLEWGGAQRLPLLPGLNIGAPSVPMFSLYGGIWTGSAGPDAHSGSEADSNWSKRLPKKSGTHQ